MNLFEVVRCKRTSRRLSAYLDLEKGAPLTDDQIAKIKAHLEECQKCTDKLAQFSEIHFNLRNFGIGMNGDLEHIETLKLKVEQLLEGFTD